MEHYNSHVDEFGVKGMGPAEYQDRADEFLGAPKPAAVLECFRSNGDTVRLNPATDEFGILSRSGFIRTYFKPDPAVHGRPTNIDYFKWECKKRRN
jgi:filamentous hemagglutinin